MRKIGWGLSFWWFRRSGQPRVQFLLSALHFLPHTSHIFFGILRCGGSLSVVGFFVLVAGCVAAIPMTAVGRNGFLYPVSDDEIVYAKTVFGDMPVAPKNIVVSDASIKEAADFIGLCRQHIASANIVTGGIRADGCFGTNGGILNHRQVL